MGKWDGWDKWTPPTKPGTKTIAGQDPNAAAPPKKKLDRGSRRGARRCVVANGALYEAATAKAMGITGENFQSLKEAKRWMSLVEEQTAGGIRNLRRQVRFSLQTRNPAGLMEHVAFYVADFVYEEPFQGRGAFDTTATRWEEIVEDTKPGIAKKGAFREDQYLLKRRWFQAQFGKAIRET